MKTGERMGGEERGERGEKRREGRGKILKEGEKNGVKQRDEV